MAASAASGAPTGSSGAAWATGLEMGEVRMATGLVWGEGDGLKAAASRLPSSPKEEPKEAVGFQAAKLGSACWLRGSDLRRECCGALC